MDAAQGLGIVIESYALADRPWSLNDERRGGTHWAQTRERTREWRKAFWALGLQRGVRFPGPVTIEVEVSMRHPVADTGACVGAVKAAIDGLVDARVLAGDTGDIVRSITFHAPNKVGKDIPERMTLTVITA